MQKNISIVGAGLVGSLLACYLSKRGHKVNVYERRPDMRKAGYVGGRSINLALSYRGWKALKRIGLDEAVSKMVIPMHGRMIHDRAGNTQLTPYGKDGQAIFSVSRGDLNRLMVEEAEKFADVNFHFDHRCAAIDFDKNNISFRKEEDGDVTVQNADIIFGADGAFSEVRYKMQTTPGFNLHQQYEPYGYKELHIPPGAMGEHQMEKNALHIWPRGSFMMIALPNLDGSFTVTLFAPLQGEGSFGSIHNAADVQAYFIEHFPDAVPLMPELAKTYFDNPTSSLVTIRCFPWVYKNAALIGDAAHAIVPFYGQGMICGFEDVKELDEILDATNEDWPVALDKYQHQRKPNGDAILDLALHNYVEMRDLSGRKDFQLRTQIEKKIADHFSPRFMTHYSMVVFSDLSYNEAKLRGEKQNELLDKIMAMPDIENRWQSEEVMKLAEDWINNN